MALKSFSKFYLDLFFRYPHLKLVPSRCIGNKLIHFIQYMPEGLRL